MSNWDSTHFSSPRYFFLIFISFLLYRLRYELSGPFSGSAALNIICTAVGQKNEKKRRGNNKRGDTSRTGAFY